MEASRMQTRTIIDKIEIEPQTGNVFVKIQKQIVDGDQILASQPHRTVIGPGVTAAGQMALVNDHLASMGHPAVKAEDVAVLDAALANLAGHRAAKAADNKRSPQPAPSRL
jgi:hypothetical protein